MSDNEDDLLPHHKQQELCTTRLPYRQGRKLTAVKVYTINDESKHLLVFGVPALNLRQETKALFQRFGKLLLFSLTNLPSEQFTETYHAVFEHIESARVAKKMLDAKNYYGGTLHVCYAPEFESVDETREKIMLRQRHVLGRLHNLNKEANTTKNNSNTHDIHPKNDTATVVDCQAVVPIKDANKINMGFVNHIILGKRKGKTLKRSKKIKTSFTDCGDLGKGTEILDEEKKDKFIRVPIESNSDIDIIDITSTSNDVVTNIDLNYNNFGNEVVKKVPYKPANKIIFNNKKS